MLSVPLEETVPEIVDCCFPAGPEGVEYDMLHVLHMNAADVGMCCTEVDRGSCAATIAAHVDLTEPCAVSTPPAGNMLVACEHMG